MLQVDLLVHVMDNVYLMTPVGSVYTRTFSSHQNTTPIHSEWLRCRCKNGVCQEHFSCGALLEQCSQACTRVATAPVRCKAGRYRLALLSCFSGVLVPDTGCSRCVFWLQYLFNKYITLTTGCLFVCMLLWYHTFQDSPSPWKEFRSVCYQLVPAGPSLWCYLKQTRKRSLAHHIKYLLELEIPRYYWTSTHDTLRKLLCSIHGVAILMTRHLVCSSPNLFMTDEHLGVYWHMFCNLNPGDCHSTWDFFEAVESRSQSIAF